MTDANSIQRRMQEIQQSDDVALNFGKLISGKSNYKAVIEKKQIIINCRKCGKQLEEEIKFCPECGTKVWIKPTKCPKCNNKVLKEDKFCQECGQSLEAPPLN